MIDEASTFFAAQPGAAERLLELHAADGSGRCCGCTAPGYGTPHAHWPCALVLLAQAALSRRSAALRKS